jgi:hypothetical protein
MLGLLGRGSGIVPVSGVVIRVRRVFVSTRGILACRDICTTISRPVTTTTSRLFTSIRVTTTTTTTTTTCEWTTSAPKKRL